MCVWHYILFYFVVGVWLLVTPKLKDVLLFFRGVPAVILGVPTRRQGFWIWDFGTGQDSGTRDRSGTWEQWEFEPCTPTRQE